MTDQAPAMTGETTRDRLAAELDMILTSQNAAAERAEDLRRDQYAAERAAQAFDETARRQRIALLVLDGADARDRGLTEKADKANTDRRKELGR